MDKSEAKEKVFGWAMELDPYQFEELCMMVLREAEQMQYLSLTPSRQDGGIDIRASVDREMFHAQLGVQVKQNTENNTVGRPEIQKFKGALFDTGYPVGTFITSSSFTQNAEESAEQGSIRLINGDQLTEIMVRSKLGVEKSGDNEFERDDDFWKLFERANDEDLIPSYRVPQADKIEQVIHTVLAIDKDSDVKHTIADSLESRFGQPFTSRQGNYYPDAAVALGLAQKTAMGTTYMGQKIGQYSLTKKGKDYVTYRYEEQDDKANRILANCIRDLEITQRFLNELKDGREFKHQELQEFVMKETLSGEEYEEGLRESTAHRRGDTLGKWYRDKLPEVLVTGVSGNRIKGANYELSPEEGRD